MNQKIKVLHIIKSLGRGGAEMLLPETLSQHDRDNFEFHYIYFLPWKNQLVEDIRRHGGNVECIPATNNLRIMLKARSLARYLKKNKIDLVHCHLPWAGIVGRMAGRLSGVPVIYTEHNKWERYHKLTFAMNKYTFPWQKTVIAVSDDVEQSIHKFYTSPQPRVKVVLNGVNTEKFAPGGNYGDDIRASLGIPGNAKVIGVISVFRNQKRLPVWLEIAKQIHDKDSNTHFIIVGDGPLKEEIHSKAAELQLGSFVHFTGLQTEVRPYLKAMNIFMMSSEFEGLPIALLEAMSMGCVPVCTKAGGIPELVQHQVNGLLVDVSEPRKLAGEVLSLLPDEARMQQLSAAARQTVIDRFGMKQMVRSLETIYKETLN